MVADAEGHGDVFAERHGCEAVGHDEDDCDDDGIDPQDSNSLVDEVKDPWNHTATLCMALVSSAMNVEIAETTAPSIMPMMGNSSEERRGDRRSSAKNTIVPANAKVIAQVMRTRISTRHDQMTSRPSPAHSVARRGGFGRSGLGDQLQPMRAAGHGGTGEDQGDGGGNAHHEEDPCRRPGKGDRVIHRRTVRTSRARTPAWPVRVPVRLDDDVRVRASPRRKGVWGRRRGGGGMRHENRSGCRPRDGTRGV